VAPSPQSSGIPPVYTARPLSGTDLYRMGVVSACVPGNELMGTALEIDQSL
jgi:enoyl-CoA hydratase/carnithine racemase